METDYSKRELDTQFLSLKRVILDVTAHQNEKLDRIEQQVIKTNGRVTKLEFWKESVMSKVAGVVASITVGWILLKEFIFKA